MNTTTLHKYSASGTEEGVVLVVITITVSKHCLFSRAVVTHTRTRTRTHAHKYTCTHAHMHTCTPHAHAHAHAHAHSEQGFEFITCGLLRHSIVRGTMPLINDVIRCAPVSINEACSNADNASGIGQSNSEQFRALEVQTILPVPQ